MAVPRRVHEAQGKPPARRAAIETGPIHYAASLTASEAGKVRRLGAAMTRHFAADIKATAALAGDHKPFSVREVMQEALALGLHFMGIQYLGDHGAFDAAGYFGNVEALDTAPAGKKP